MGIVLLAGMSLLGPRAFAGETPLKDACRDPVAGCPQVRGRESAPALYPVEFRWFLLGLNISATTLFSGYGSGGDVAGSAGLSLPFANWMYDGHHRVTVLQLDANVGKTLEGKGAMSLLSLGPAYRPSFALWVPVIKAQVYAVEPFSRRLHKPQSLGLGLGISWDWTPGRPSSANEGDDRFVF